MVGGGSQFFFTIGTFDLWEGGGCNLGLVVWLGAVEVVMEAVGEDGGRGLGFG